MKVNAWLLGLIGVCTTAFAQPSFDAASVKPYHGAPDPEGYRNQFTPTGITMLHVSMGYCLRLAYGLQRAYELIGPAWLDPPTENLFDIVARVAQPASEDQIRAMLRTLLAERFHLVARVEDRELPAYTLRAARSPLPLRPSAAGTATHIQVGGRPYVLEFHHVSMPQLAMQFGPPMTSRPVVDATGIAGSFDFELDLARYILDSATGKPLMDEKGRVDEEGAILRGVKDQLGLILQTGRAPVRVLVIERVDKIPTAN